MGSDLSRAQIPGATDTETLQRALNDPVSRRRARSIPFEIRDIERRSAKNKKGMSPRMRDRIERLEREAKAISQGRKRIEKELNRRTKGNKKPKAGNPTPKAKTAAKKATEAAKATETTTKRAAKKAS